VSKAIKFILGLIIVLGVLVGGAVWFVSANLDDLVKQIIEETGTETLGTQVSVSNVAITIPEASAALQGLSIANPAGFNEPQAFSLGEIAVALDAQASSAEEVVIKSILIDQAALNFEQVGMRNNLKTLLDAIDTGAAESSADSDSASEDIRLVIDELRIRATRLTVTADQISAPLNVTLPDIVVRNIGTRGAGVTADEAAEQIMGPILNQVQDAAKDRIKDELEAMAREELD